MTVERSREQKLFAGNLRHYRKERGWSQTELGRRLDLQSGAMVHRWEKGEYPTLDRLMALCRILGVEPNDLLSAPLRAAAYGGNAAFKWRIVQPLPDRTSQKDILRGIDLFQQLVEEEKTFAEIHAQPRYRIHHPSTLRRWLRLAFLTGSIEIFAIQRDVEKENALKERYGKRLRQCFIARSQFQPIYEINYTIHLELVARLAAEETLAAIPNGGYIGVTGGVLMTRFADVIPHNPDLLNGTTWVPLLVTKPSDEEVDTSTNVVASRVGYNHPGVKIKYLPFVSLERRSWEYIDRVEGDEKDFLLRASGILETARQKVDTVFTSVGEQKYDPRYMDACLGLGMPEVNNLVQRASQEKQKNCVGIIFLYLIDKEGNPWGDEATRKANREAFYGLEMEDLKNIVARGGTVWNFVETPEKALNTHACLKAGLINCLVMESNAAQSLLDVAHADGW